MKQRNVTEIESSFEQQIRQMPKVEDRRSKEEIYGLVQKGLEKNPPRKRGNFKWVAPSIASAAAVVLLAVLAPSILNSGEEELSLQSTEIGLPESSEIAVVDDPGNEIGMMQAPESSPELEANYYSAIRQEELEEYEHAVTVAYIDEQAQYLVPISFIYEKQEGMFEKIKTFVTEFNPETVGLMESPLNKVVFMSSENDTEVVLDFQEAAFFGSTETEAIRAAIGKTFGGLGYEKAILKTEDQVGLLFGNEGEIGDMPLEYKEVGYRVLTTETGEQFLVSGTYIGGSESAPDSFQGLVEYMAIPFQENGVENLIPPSIQIENIDTGKGEFVITFAEGTNLAEEPRAQAVIEGLLLTAKSFDGQSIQFEQAGTNQVGPYDLTGPISTTIFANGIH
ncbi:hypothetical protein [Bacillus alkalicellulosilyticus]|uniref:hypothetical protein n=1 Tax=Alkalihalobacterium alkalicellulosilyticum TaxID=1912214 RepID=UPI000997A9A6|nr:hypothetical protein [Bacillus alkalicellulosilyticus]